MDKQSDSAQAAIRLHQAFLQEVLARVMTVLGQGVASEQRLAAALEAYWEASFERRDTRLGVLRDTQGTDLEGAVEPKGRPFLIMVRAELRPRFDRQAESLALQVYEQARALAVREAQDGVRDPEGRRRILELILA